VTITRAEMIEEIHAKCKEWTKIVRRRKRKRGRRSCNQMKKAGKVYGLTETGRRRGSDCCEKG